MLGVDAGPTGVATAGSRYVTLPAGGATIVARIDPRGGRVLGSRLLAGDLTIPAVAYDGSADGLSGDGRTLVLIEPRIAFPRARTTLAVLDAPGLRPRATIRLRGDFSFDAISPDGSTLYLIEYTSPTDPTDYAVRAYEVADRRLLPAPVVDPHEPDEAMTGSPSTRTTSADGRWAYTLYERPGEAPFVHALDTASRTARCVDLDLLAGAPIDRPRLVLARGTLTVEAGRTRLALVDTRTFRVTAPGEPRRASGAEVRDAGTGLVVAAAGVAVALALLAGGSLAVRRRRRPALAE